jgi:hypothetical protein
MADLLYKLWGAVSLHRTKIMGSIVVIMAWLEDHPELVPMQYHSGVAALSGILVILCGVGNTTAIANKLKGKS